MHKLFCVVLGVVLLSACATHRHAQVPEKRTAGLPRLGNYSMRITTQSTEAQRAFDRGLTLAYSFGHFAAEQEFQRAADADPNCAMAYWGIALVNGPHINFPLVPPDHAAKAWEAISRAKSLASGVTPLEQALIAALAKRYANPQPENRAALDEAYAEAMRDVWQRYPHHADAGTLFAEAAMDLHPWNLWKDGTAQAWTPEIVETLENVLRFAPSHPGANHLYIHAIEASSDPKKALSAADQLGALVPDSSHMVHMPSHIYARVGQWEKATLANRKAMKADEVYRRVYPRPGFYAMYMAHNAHFLAFTAMMRGRSAEAIETARIMVKGIPEDFLQQYAAVADGYMIFTSEVLMRFGKWQEILAEPKPRPDLPLATAMWHFTRATAYAALGQMPQAKTEQDEFNAASARMPKDSTFGNNASADIVQIGKLVLEGELAAQQNDFATATAKLKEAVKHEDALRYNEPPDWIQPVRHTLGAVLLRSGDALAAEQVYRDDLAHYPGNGWSLMGLRDSLTMQGKQDESALVAARFKKAWSAADVKPGVTCYCLAGK